MLSRISFFEEGAENKTLPKKWVSLLLAGILLFSFLLKLPRLGHPELSAADEGCHAVVAKNLLKHPLKPTLIEVPYLFYNEHTWSGNHVWLHKPTLPLWQIACAYSILGVNTFALRFPSALLCTFAAWLTYLIGIELSNRWAAFIAASIQAFSGFIVQVVHGYIFSDAIDISLLFYCELGIYGVIRAVKTGQWRFVLLVGIGQGLAFLSKTYPAFIVTGVALVAWLAPYLALAKMEDCHLRWRHILGLLGVTLLVAGPWTLFTAIQYPIEFKISTLVTFSHFTEDLQGWGAPWHKLLWNYNWQMYGGFYVLIVLAVILSAKRTFGSGIAKALRLKRLTGIIEPDFGLLLLYGWGFGVLIPFLLATTKTPTATLIGMPAFLLILGNFIVRTTRNKKEDGFPKRALRKVCMGVLILLLTHEVFNAWWMTRPDIFYQVNEKHTKPRTFSEVANFVQAQLPDHAVLLTEVHRDNQYADHLRLMFLTSQTVHPYHGQAGLLGFCTQIQKHSGIPYIITFRKLNLPVIFKSYTDRITIYSPSSHMSSKTDEPAEVLQNRNNPSQ